MTTPATRDKENLPTLLQIIRSEIACEGRISNERFMALALHHQNKGYYRSRTRVIGPDGDFTTCPAIDPVLGHSIAAWFSMWIRGVSGKKGLTIVECGAGRGDLAQTLLSSFPRHLNARLHYCILDRNESLVTLQREKLVDFTNVSWYETMSSVFNTIDRTHTTLILANEFVDSFPVRVFRWQDSNWQELFLVSSGRTLEECFAEANPPIDPIRDGVFQTRIPPTEGQRVETHGSFYDWWSTWNHLVGQAGMLIIDYGDHYPALYHRKPLGSLRAYWRQRLLPGEDVYLRPGQQDITADVNFSDLERWGRHLGWTVDSCLPQRDFIMKYAARRRFPGIKTFHPATEGAEFLINPLGAGIHFKMLLLVRP